MPVLDTHGLRPRAWTKNLLTATGGSQNSPVGPEGNLAARLTYSHRREGVLLLALLIALGIAYRLSGKPEVRNFLWVIEVAETGQIRNVGMLPQQPWQHLIDPVVDFVARQWLVNSRTVGDSEVLLGQAWNQALAFTAPKLQPWLRGEMRDSYERIWKKKQTVQVQQLQVLPIAKGKNAYKMTWIEKTVNVSGETDKTWQWEATFTVGVYPPGQQTNNQDKEKEKEDPRKWRNMLGIQIEEAHWLALAPIKKEKS